MRNKTVRLTYYIFLSVLTAMVLLLQFVISYGGSTVNIDNSYDDFVDSTGGDSSSTDGTTTVTTAAILEDATVIGSYSNDTVDITIYQIRLYSSDIYVADIVADNPGVILSALAYDNFGGSNIVQTVSTMAENKGAVLAINADYASHWSSGIVIRNGQILRSSISDRTDVALYTDGTMATFKESSTTAQSLLSAGAWQVYSFGPALVQDGVVVENSLDGSHVSQTNPRTGIGMVEANHYMFVCVDGRTSQSEGVNIVEFGDVMYQLGCTVAYNLDGGGSSTMVFEGEVINVPSGGDEREVGDCIYVIY